MYGIGSHGFSSGRMLVYSSVLTADPWTKTHATMLCAYTPT